MSTFTLEDHGDTVMVLAMEPSKLLGYRDSHILFQKHSQLRRIRITDEERQHLIDTGLLVTRFKNPEVAVVTARSLFKVFGHRVIEHGKRVKDDYFEAEPERHVVFSTANNNAHLKTFVMDDSKDDEEIDDHSRKSLIGKTSRSESYASSAPLTNQTWMHHAALAARGFNAQLHERRAEKPVFYDIHSNINQVPASYQPNECRFEFSKEDINGNSEGVMRVEFTKKTNTHNTPAYRGIGKNLLDYDIESVLSSFATNAEKEQAKMLLSNQEKIVGIDDNVDENYPLALMDGQYQNAFPM